MSVDAKELLEFIKEVLSREDRTLADDGVMLCEEIREEGCRLLHEAGWTTPFEDAEAESEPTEPEEEDLITYDFRTFYVAGHHSVFDVKLERNCKVKVGPDEDWKPAVKAYMDKHQFWTNVWWISDHGNANLLSLQEEDT
jgi:hypothetical protein